MKKTIIAATLLCVSLGGAYLVYQNLPQKRYERHMIRARLFIKENNYTAALKEYESAYNAKESFTPYSSLEVLQLTNAMAMRDGKTGEALENTRAFVRQNPKSKEGKFTLSQLALQSGDMETAFTALQEILVEDPVHYPTRHMLAQIRTQQGRLDLAEEQLRVLYKAHPDSLPSILPLAENLLKQGRVQESRIFLKQIQEEHPKNGAARLLLFDSYLVHNQADSAGALLDDWLNADSSLAFPITIRKARLHAARGRPDSAAQELAPYLHGKTEHLAAYSELALLRAREGKYDSAISLYNTLGNLNPASRSGAWSMAMLLHLKNQNPAMALEILKKLQIEVKSATLLQFHIAAYKALGQEHKALELWNQENDSLKKVLSPFLSQLVADRKFIGQWALVHYFQQNQYSLGALASAHALHKSWPRNPLASMLFVGQLAGLGRFGDAAHLMESMKDLSFSQRIFRLDLLLKAGRHDKVFSLAQQLNRENPEYPGLNIVLADYHIRRGNKIAAAGLWKKELNIDSGNQVALNNLAWEYGVEQLDFAKAKPYMEKLESKKQMDPRILDTIGWILANNGKLGEAESILRRALYLVPDHPTMLYHLAWVQLKSGKSEEGKAYLQRALASKWPFQEKPEARKLLTEAD